MSSGRNEITKLHVFFVFVLKSDQISLARRSLLLYVPSSYTTIDFAVIDNIMYGSGLMFIVYVLLTIILAEWLLKMDEIQRR